MFEILVAAEPGTPFSGNVAAALRRARLRVIACEMGALDRPPSSFRVDAAVACAASTADVGSMARGIRASLTGPPPVVGISRTAGGPTPPGTVDILTADAPESLVVARVMNAASGRERDRSRTLLSGDLAGVGVSALLESLGSRHHTGVVRVRADGRKAELTLEGGAVVQARADGVTAASLAAVIEEIDTWQGATFDVLGSAERPAAVPRPPAMQPPLAETGDGSDVALAAAVMNAVAGYARTFLPTDTVVELLERSRLAAQQVDAGIAAFSVSRSGTVSVTRISLARSALPHALASWCRAFFLECERTLPSRFQSSDLGAVLGGLCRLIEKIGWSKPLLRED